MELLLFKSGDCCRDDFRREFVGGHQDQYATHKGICIVTTQAVTSASDGFTLNSPANIFQNWTVQYWLTRLAAIRTSPPPSPIRLVADSVRTRPSLLVPKRTFQKRACSH